MRTWLLVWASSWTVLTYELLEALAICFTPVLSGFVKRLDRGLLPREPKMEVEALLIYRGNEIGSSGDVVRALHDAVKPLVAKFAEPIDLGVYFHSAERCDSFCCRQSLDPECAILLWDVCSLLRDQLEGTIAADYHAMCHESETKTAISRHVESFPLFGGELIFLYFFISFNLSFLFM